MRERIITWLFILTAIIAFVFMAFPHTEEVDAALSPIEYCEAETVIYYDVPINRELQDYIRKLCDEYNVDMPLVLAVIGQESNYDPNVIGDNGNSIGLMQIQPQHHQKRMDRLNVTDLSNPVQNVTIGVDLLAELIAKEKGLEWALTAYNAGAEKADFNKNIGTTGEYAESVLKLKEAIK